MTKKTVKKSPSAGKKSAETKRPLKEKERQVRIRRDAIAALVVVVGIPAAVLIFGPGGIRDQIRNSRVRAELVAKGAKIDSVTGNALSKQRYTEAMTMRDDEMVTEVICGVRYRLRASAMKDARALDRCLRDRSEDKRFCMPATSTFRTNGDQERIAKSGLYPVVAGLDDSPHLLGRDWDVTEETAKNLEDYSCICVGPKKAPKDEDDKPVIRCGGYRGVPDDPYHIYPGKPMRGKLKAAMARGAWETSKRSGAKLGRGAKKLWGKLFGDDEDENGKK